MIMLIEPADISADAVKILWCGGIHPTLKGRHILMYVSINIVCYVLTMVLAVKGMFFFYKNGNIFYMSECFQTIVLMIHLTVKLLTLHTQKNGLLRLMKVKAKFWKISEFDEDVYIECLKILTIVKIITRGFFIISFFTAFIFALQPFTSGYLPTAVYCPAGWYDFLKYEMWYIAALAVFILPGTDLYFCSLVFAIVIQIKLLSFRYKNIPHSQQLWEELRILVDYHNLLLSCCEDLNKIFRNIFLLQFGIAIASCGISVFIFMQPGSWSIRIKFAQYFFFTMIQTGFYCIPLEIVISSVESLGDEVYDSEWYRINVIQFKKCLGLVMNRAQKRLIFSGHGLIYMDLRTYVTIMKTVFSFYTYLQTMEKLSRK